MCRKCPSCRLGCCYLFYGHETTFIPCNGYNWFLLDRNCVELRNSNCCLFTRLIHRSFTGKYFCQGGNSTTPRYSNLCRIIRYYLAVHGTIPVWFRRYTSYQVLHSPSGLRWFWTEFRPARLICESRVDLHTECQSRFLLPWLIVFIRDA